MKSTGIRDNAFKTILFTISFFIRWYSTITSDSTGTPGPVSLYYLHRYISLLGLSHEPIPVPAAC